MSTETKGGFEGASSEDEFEVSAICIDANQNIGFEDGSSLEDNFPQSYMKAITLLGLNHTVRGPKFQCPECDYYLHTRLSMNTHMKMHRKPFCPICFITFAGDQEANAHLTQFHPEFFSTVASSTTVPADPLMVTEENSYNQTEAPPNSPTSEYKGLSELEYGFANSNNNSIPYLLAEKLREHQAMASLGLRKKRLLTSHLPVRPNTGTGGRRERRMSIAGVSGKVHKPVVGKPKPSPSPKSTNSPRSEIGGDTEDNALKRITSRFGRSISLKVPQF